ncbi:MAG TPA: acyl carrier protein [Ruminococcus sp.]|nr:acyl carrier protein [Ruminococcus sp.]
MKEKVIEILKNNIEELEGVEINGSTQLITSGYIDSFDIINVISLLEQEFNTSIDLEDIELEQFDTVDSICAILEGKA